MRASWFYSVCRRSCCCLFWHRTLISQTAQRRSIKSTSQSWSYAELVELIQTFRSSPNFTGVNKYGIWCRFSTTVAVDAFWFRKGATSKNCDLEAQITGLSFPSLVEFGALSYENRGYIIARPKTGWENCALAMIALKFDSLADYWSCRPHVTRVQGYCFIGTGSRNSRLLICAVKKIAEYLLWSSNYCAV